MTILGILICVESLGLILSFFLLYQYYDLFGSIHIQQGEFIKWAGIIPFSILVYFLTRAKDFLVPMAEFERWKTLPKFKLIYYSNISYLLIFSIYSIAGFLVFENQGDNLRGLMMVISAIFLSIYTGGIMWFAEIKLSQLLKKHDSP